MCLGRENWCADTEAPRFVIAFRLSGEFPQITILCDVGRQLFYRFLAHDRLLRYIRPWRIWQEPSEIFENDGLELGSGFEPPTSRHSAEYAFQFDRATLGALPTELPQHEQNLADFRYRGKNLYLCCIEKLASLQDNSRT